MKFIKRYYSQLIFLMIGLLAGFFISRLPIEFDPKTNWVTLANFFLTILLALYLEFVVRPSFSNNRNEKDLLISQLNDIRKSIVEIFDAYTEARKDNPVSGYRKTELIAKFRTLSNQIDMLKKADEYCEITKDSSMSDKLVDLYIAYKKSLTGYGFNKANFFYDRLHWYQHKTTFQKIMTGIVHSIIDVNKL